MSEYTSGNEKLDLLHALIDKRGEYASNLTPAETKSYAELCEWYNKSN